jgi:hypothetical protein
MNLIHDLSATLWPDITQAGCLLRLAERDAKAGG